VHRERVYGQQRGRDARLELGVFDAQQHELADVQLDLQQLGALPLRLLFERRVCQDGHRLLDLHLVSDGYVSDVVDADPAEELARLAEVHVDHAEGFRV